MQKDDFVFFEPKYLDDYTLSNHIVKYIIEPLKYIATGWFFFQITKLLKDTLITAWKLLLISVNRAINNNHNNCILIYIVALFR